MLTNHFVSPCLTCMFLSTKLVLTLNSFVLLTFDKTVILEVSRTGTINLALRPDVYCIILQSLEVLSRLKACFFYAMDA